MPFTDFALSVVSNLAGNILTVIFLALVAFLAAVSARKLSILKNRKPYSQMIVDDPALTSYFCQHSDINTRYHTKSRFKNIIPEWHIEFLVEYYNKLTGSRSFNGPCVRLDGYTVENDCLTLELSTVGFYDLLSTNMTVFPGNVRYSGFWKYISLLSYLPGYYSVLAEYKNKIFSGKDDPEFPEIIGNNRLANVLAVSAMVMDSQGNTLIVKRTSSLAISGSIYSVASTGTVIESDLVGEKGNVLSRAAVREITEETGIIPDSVRILDIVLTKQKYQPIALARCDVADLKSALLNTAKAKDFPQEVREMYILNMSDVKTFFAVLSKAELSPASAYSLELAFRQFHNISGGEFEIMRRKRFRNIGNYKLFSEWKYRSKVITTS
ncbi:MAG: NUDIX domain-containing protein [Dehalococcoidia bacterium]|nr:MAG: NUDIX domain-containing protein [Dehalococcoidia bacterium]